MRALHLLFSLAVGRACRDLCFFTSPDVRRGYSAPARGDLGDCPLALGCCTPSAEWLIAFRGSLSTPSEARARLCSTNKTRPSLLTEPLLFPSRGRLAPTFEYNWDFTFKLETLQVLGPSNPSLLEASGNTCSDLPLSTLPD